MSRILGESDDARQHLDADVTTITAGSPDPPSDLPKQAKAGEHRLRKLHTHVYTHIIVVKL
jgi:hypothetical protein